MEAVISCNISISVTADRETCDHKPEGNGSTGIEAPTSKKKAGKSLSDIKPTLEAPS